MVAKDKDQIRRIGHLKVAVGFLILAVFGPLMWLTTSLSIDHPSARIYNLEFIILTITAFVLIEASSRIIDRVYSGKKN